MNNLFLGPCKWLGFLSTDIKRGPFSLLSFVHCEWTQDETTFIVMYDWCWIPLDVQRRWNCVYGFLENCLNFLMFCGLLPVLFLCIFSLHIRSMWETICDPTASLLGWLSLSDSFSQWPPGSLSQSDLVFCAFTDVAGSLSQSDLVFCAFTDVACGWKWPIFCTGSYPLWRLIFSIRLMF